MALVAPPREAADVDDEGSGKLDSTADNVTASPLSSCPASPVGSTNLSPNHGAKMLWSDLSDSENEDLALPPSTPRVPHREPTGVDHADGPSSSCPASPGGSTDLSPKQTADPQSLSATRRNLRHQKLNCVEPSSVNLAIRCKIGPAGCHRQHHFLSSGNRLPVREHDGLQNVIDDTFNDAPKTKIAAHDFPHLHWIVVWILNNRHGRPLKLREVYWEIFCAFRGFRTDEKLLRADGSVVEKRMKNEMIRHVFGCSEWGFSKLKTLLDKLVERRDLFPELAIELASRPKTQKKKADQKKEAVRPLVTGSAQISSMDEQHEFQICFRERVV